MRSYSRRELLQAAALSSALPGLLALTGCGGGDSGGGATPAPTANLPRAVADAQARSAPVTPALVTADNTFGFKLFDALRTVDTTKNVFVSPASVALAFQIAYNGANGTTRTAMAQALQVSGFSVADLNSANAALQASLVSLDPKVEINIANSLWLRQSAGVKADFVAVNRDYYGSEVGDVAGAPANVNAWVASKTNNRIPTLLPDGDYSNVVAILANAVYFKGAWTTAFNAAQTTDAPFTTSNGTTVTSKLMHLSLDNFSYYKGNNYQMVRLPYGAGRLSMVAVLPDASVTLPTVLGGLNATTFNTALAQLHTAAGNVALPRFTTRYGTELRAALTALGMGVAFDENAADFSNLAPSVFIGRAYHKTYVSVDEQGTEAAGGTGIVVVPTSAPGNTFTMQMDRPFFYAIRDDKTGVILFMGVLANPADAGQ